MPQLRLALAQVDTCVGDLQGNADLVLRWTRHAAEQGAHLVLFPEMTLTGYPAEDLALRPSFVDASRQALERLAAGCRTRGSAPCPWSSATSTAAPIRCRGWPPAGEPQNAAAWLHGRVVARYAKHHLPNYGVFDEFRYFVPGERVPVVRLHGIDIATTICEDLWQEGGPLSVAADAGAGLVSASTVRRTRSTRTTPAASWSASGPRRRTCRSPTSTWSAARTSSSSTATRW